MSTRPYARASARRKPTADDEKTGLVPSSLFAKDNGWHPDDSAWIADAEQALTPTVALDTDGTAMFKQVCDAKPGSFQ